MRLLPAALVLGFVGLLGLPQQSAQAAQSAGFPDGYQGYHTYAGMVADIDSVVAQYGTGTSPIIRKFSIGKSYLGRDIWAVEISNDVNVDQVEPEVLFESLHHAREHLVVEMDLYLIHLLTDNYRANSADIQTDLQRRVTDIVNSREIWIVPMANPDGEEYDISGGTFHHWRKNRQDIPGSTAIGIDLNRNWGFKWGCCGGSSGNPASITYRGPSPWYAPEVAALRDFVLSRRVDGRQQITEAISWHTYGELVMWPYGYTYKDVPKTMTPDDHAALVAIGQGMAALNGYIPQQASDLYITDGAASDWLYGDQRIFAYTIEMYPPDPSNLGGFYPPDDGSPGGVIDIQTARNRDAVMYFLDQADCPYRAAGLATDCGPLYDDFEADRGWVVNQFGADTATTGVWERAVPSKTKDAAGAKQLATVPSGLDDLVTGATAGATPDANAVDGLTTVSSPALMLGAPSTTGWQLTFRWTFAHNATSTTADFLRLSGYDPAAHHATTLWQVRGGNTNRNATWKSRTVDLDAFAGKDIELVFQANSSTSAALVEAAVDDVRVYQAPSP